MKRRLFAIALLLLTSACAKEPTGPSTPPRITALPRALTSGEQRLIDADNRLAIKPCARISLARFCSWA
jgi:hypothetical protein